ncbi:MAG: hypothetical protein HZA08_12925 [Nitrospirae bacterium]|nr:hypothetical protein [Nitrospirota bacterium]
MSYDILIDYILKEGDKRRDELLSEAGQKAAVMLAELDIKIAGRREDAIRNIKKELEGYRIKELNKARFQAKSFAASAQGEVIEEVFKEAAFVFQSIAEGPSYPSILKSFLIEGLQAIEGEVHVKTNSRDCHIIKDILKDIALTALANCEVISINSDDSIIGGVEILSQDKCVTVINTLWSRFDKVKEDLMPDMREILFGGIEVW